MRLHVWTALGSACAAAFCCAAWTGEPPENELTAPPSYDLVVCGLIGNLSRDATTAQDAAAKLSRLGKRAIPALAESLKANLVPEPPPGTAPPPDAKAKQQITFYTALALSRIKSADAARLLLPILGNSKAGPELRTVALDAYGLELLPEGAAALQKIAAGDPDLQMRKKAFGQLALMPNFWAQSEKLVLDALSDPDDDIRALAAKQCWFARIYQSTVDKLIELAEKDTVPAVRSHALLALSRMRIPRAVPAAVRICLKPDLSPAEQRQALYVLSELTRVGLKDSNAVEAWWKKSGQAEYGKLEAPGKLEAGAAPLPEKAPPRPPPDSPGADKKPNP